MDDRLLIIKYSICALVFVSAAAMVHSFPTESITAQGDAVATEVNDAPSEQMTNNQTAPTTSAKVTIGSL